MLTTVNKKIILTALVLSFGMIAIISSQRLLNSQNVDLSKIGPTYSNVPAEHSMGAVNAPIPSVSISKIVTIDAGEIQEQITGLNATALQERKLQVEHEIKSKQLIERFNQHKLSTEETLELRRLALEKGLITIRLSEID